MVSKSRQTTSAESLYGASPMKLIAHSVLAIVLSMVSLAGAAAVHFETNRSYRYELYSSPKDCEAARASGAFNCFRWMDFSSDGRVTLVVTDIINDGTYQIDDQKVVLKFDRPGDVPREMVFEFSADDTQLVEPSTGHVWKLVDNELH